MKTSRNRKTRRSLLPYGNLGNDWRDGWTNVNGSGGVSLRLVEGVRTYLDISGTTLVSKRVPMPVDPKLLTGSELGYRLHMRYQPTENETPPEPNATLYAHPSGHYAVLPLPVPGDGKRNTGEWLTIEADFPEVAGDSSFELHLASGQQADDAPPDDPADDAREPNWPVRPGQVHISGALIQDPNDDGVSVRLHLPGLALRDAPLPISLDGVAARWKVDGKIPICIGARHTLTLPIDDACGWGGSADGTYPGSLAYAYWQDSSSEDLTLTPTAPTAPHDDAQLARDAWKLDCPIETEAGVTHGITFESAYDAPPFTLDCITGEFKVYVEDIQGPDYWPCVPLDETAHVRARVMNALTHTPSAGLRVTWQADGVDIGTSTTNADGWVGVTFTPKADTTVTAIADAPFNEAPAAASVEVRTLSRLPWECFSLTLDGRVIEPIDGRLLIYSGAASHKLALKPVADNASIGKACSISYAPSNDIDDDENISFNPAQGVAREMGPDGLEWTLTGPAGDPVFPFEIKFDCEPWQSPFSAFGVVVEGPIELFAFPTDATCMRDDAFVFGPVYNRAEETKGIIIEARVANGGLPRPGIPCSIGAVYPPTAIEAGAMSIPLGKTQLTGADGRTVFPVSYDDYLHLYPMEAFTIVGAEAVKRYPMQCRRTPSNPQDLALLATLYPGRPEYGDAFASPHFRMFISMGVYRSRYVDPVPSFGNDAEILLDLADGSRLGPYVFKPEWTSVKPTVTSIHIQARLDLDLPHGEYAPVVMAHVRAKGDMEKEYFFDFDRATTVDHVNMDFSPDPVDYPVHELYLYCPVTTLPAGEPFLLQWQTWSNTLPDEKYKLLIEPKVDEATILPFDFGEVATARVCSSTPTTTRIRLERMLSKYRGRIVATMDLTWV
ncbi:hypothetical protein UC34_11600 [Pandoraea vervacti]|uniref:Big-1 domain-containing protein n=1 Tax=Pandoraea vervacti TaxID=656178 RepID=A0ABM5SY90_9BURK|nr:Ig-like domain-containing protein [Pandoraea vervacti]AJP57493.1 hypothetical protein UC34_11600 [Pandoraea vervacti]